jgi:site-specific DNA recombinase
MEQEKARAYIRVSTADQAKHGLSLDAQLHSIKLYCELHNLEFTGYEIDSISGKNLKDRPGALRLLQEAKEGKFKNIVILRLDRMFRNTIETISTINELKDVGVRFHSLHEQLDTDTPLGRFAITMMAALGQMEAERISEKTKEILVYKKEIGHKIGRFTTLGKTLGEPDAKDGKRRQQVENETEIEAAICCQKLRYNEGYSYRKLSTTLASWGYLSRTGKPYCPTTIRKMIAMEVRNGVQMQ